MSPDNLSIPLRPPEQVMDLARLGQGFASRLSFMRVLIRRMRDERWRIKYSDFNLDNQGYGHAIFNIKTSNDEFSFVVFSQYLDPSERNDRVIAEKWDLTMTLMQGKVDSSTLANLADNVPLQEMGRINSRCLALSRANRSGRLFDTVLADLRQGNQPDSHLLAQVGYLYRTTAVYGSGKFGAADWEAVQKRFIDFERPFSAEMLVCYLIRQFSLDQLHHLAQQPDYPQAVSLDKKLQRYLGIGNSTGLGMAPWLINHPMVISQWALQRETAYALALSMPVDTHKFTQFTQLVSRACQHVNQVDTQDEWQQRNNVQVVADLYHLQDRLQQTDMASMSWLQIKTWAEQDYSVETQELLVSVMIELYPQQVDNLVDSMSIDESWQYDPIQPAQQLMHSIETSYAWAFDYDFVDVQQDRTFWYYSITKVEPRLGKVGLDEGRHLQMYMGIAKAVQLCYQSLAQYIKQEPNCTVGDFLLAHPQHQGIVPRVMSLSNTYYGEIRANLLADEVLPMYLLRAKLANFGVSKFDPKSKLWVRNTMFQGAPVLADLMQGEITDQDEDWLFPVIKMSSVDNDHAMATASINLAGVG